MFYSKEMIHNMGCDSIEEFVTQYMKTHTHCAFEYRSDGVYAYGDFDTSIGTLNQGYIKEFMPGITIEPFDGDTSLASLKIGLED